LNVPTQMLKLAPLLPRARRWVREALVAHAHLAQPVMAFDQSSNLRGWFDPQVLADARFIAVSRVPVPPMEQWGIVRGDQLLSDPAGITFANTFFVRDGACTASLFFHELVHVVQWRVLGEARFLLLYGLLLAERGYREHPLERMAFDLQACFDAGDTPRNLTPEIERANRQGLARFAARSVAHRLLVAAAPLLARLPV
jgi:hypothetical protein